jgi:hypothetical protein
VAAATLEINIQETLMNDLTEEEMRQALFGAAEAPTPKHVHVSAPTKAGPDVIILPPTAAVKKKKLPKPYTPRLRITLRVGNVFEGETQEFVHEADTLSTLLAEQEAVKLARKKFRYIELVSVKTM